MTPFRFALIAAIAFAFAPLSQSAEPNRYVPADATIVVHVNVRQLLDSPLGKKYGPNIVQGLLQQNGQVQNLLAGMGVDPLKDVDAIVLATPGASADRAVVIAHGRIDQERFHKAAEELSKQGGAMKIHQEAALTIYEGKQGNDSAFAVFPARDTLLLSPSRTALTGAAAGNQRLSKELAPVVAGVDGNQSVWVAALMPEEAKAVLAGQPQTAELASKIQAVTAGLNIDRDVALNVKVLTTEAKAASTLAELIDGLKGFGKLYAASVPQFGPLLTQVMDSIKVGTNQTTVSATVNVTEQMIEQGVQAAKTPPPPPAAPTPVPVRKAPPKKR